jgi:hypothetical protein
MPATLLDIAKLNGNDAVVGLIEENLRFAPELSHLPYRTIRGTSYKTGIRTGLPTAQFRGANEGVTLSQSVFRQALIECFPLSIEMQADAAVADADEDGRAAYLAKEADGAMRSALQTLGRQIFDGVSADAKGFPGLKSATPAGTSTAQGNALTIDATGTTASTASSVYLVAAGVKDIHVVGGRNTTFELEPEWIRQQVAASGGGVFTAFTNALASWCGLQLGHENAVRRIYNLTADSGKGLTDALLARALATFPVGVMPSVIFMSRRSRMQLQISRTVVLQGNARVRPDQATIAPVPTEYEGIPIVATDSILDTDAIGA